MAKQLIGLGTTANDGTGSPLRTGGEIVNENFTELYDRTDGNSPHQVIPANVIWANLSATVQEQDLIWAAVNADLTTIVKHNHDLIFRTVRKVYGQVGSIKTYDVYETYWRLRDKLTVIGGSNVSLGSGNTQLDSTNGIMTFAGRKITKVVDGVIQEGGFTVDFGATGATPIEDSVNAGALYETGKGLFLFKGNDGTDDYLYIYNGVESKIGSGSGVTTSATDFSILTEGTADSAPTDGQTIKIKGDTGEGEFPLAIDFVGADVTRDGATDHAIVTVTGGGAVQQKTGSTIDFTENSFWNNVTPLTTNFTLSETNAVLGKCAIIYHEGTTEPVVTTSLDVSIKSGRFRVGKLNTYNYIFNGIGYNLVINSDNTEQLNAPGLTVLRASTTSLDVVLVAPTSATSYDLLISQTNDVGTATAVAGYDGVSLTYEITALTQGVTYYVFCRAKASGFASSVYVSASGIPDVPLVPLFFYTFDGAVLDTAKFALVDGTNVAYTQNNEGIFTDTGTGTSGGEYLTTDGLFTFDTSTGDKYLYFDIARTGNTDNFFQIILLGTNNFIRIMTDDGEGNTIKILNTIDSVAQSEVVTTSEFSSTIKAKFSSESLQLYKFDGAEYQLIGTAAFGDSTYFLRFNKAGDTTTGSTTTIDNVYIMDEDSPGQYPDI